jgi:phospholipase/carboxylesterase
MIPRIANVVGALLALFIFAAPASAEQPPLLHSRPTAVAMTLKPGTTGLTEFAYAYRPASVTGPAPLIVLLHGAGDLASEMIDLFKPTADRRGAILLALQSTAATWHMASGSGGPADFGPDPEHLDAALAKLFAEAPIDPHRVVLAGHSDGASYALSLGAANPQLFRSLVALSPGYVVLGANVDRSQRVFIAHGRNDDMLTPENLTENIIPQLQRAGLQPKIFWFDGGHVINKSATRQALDAALGPAR